MSRLFKSLVVPVGFVVSLTSLPTMAASSKTDPAKAYEQVIAACKAAMKNAATQAKREEAGTKCVTTATVFHEKFPNFVPPTAHQPQRLACFEDRMMCVWWCCCLYGHVQSGKIPFCKPNPGE
jgi:hypothetical protein